jgi:hypothetical protein
LCDQHEVRENPLKPKSVRRRQDATARSPRGHAANNLALAKPLMLSF